MATPPDDIDTSLLKVPPHSIEAERSVLGGLMLDNQAWDTVSSMLGIEDFYRAEHRTIYKCMADLDGRKQPFDIITIAETLENKGELDRVGGMPFISELMASTPTAVNINAYAEIVREKATTRSLIEAANAIADSGFNPRGRNSATLIDEAESKVFKISDDRPSRGGPESLKPLLAETVERIDELYRTKGAMTGISTGFKDLDEMTAGLQKADLIIVAGRPSMGKTALMMNMAESAAFSDKEPGPVLVFSLEMPATSLVQRMLSSLGRIDQRKIRSGQLKDDDWTRLVSTVTLLKDVPIFIDDSPALTPNEIRSRARRVAREHGTLEMIVIDYLQLMQIAGAPENRTAEISEISRSLKTIAKEFNCPVVAGSQFNRALEQRHDRRPVMSDLRESGAIEQDADVIMGIYRDEVYNEDSPVKGQAEVIILKQRNGPIGKRKLAFSGEFTRFDDLTTDYDGYV